MTDTTTIQIKTEQKAQLDELKRVDNEAYHSVVARLIENYNNEKGEVIGDYSQVMKRIDDLENTLPRKVSEELQR